MTRALNPAQRSLLALNVVGGIAVLGSYWAGLALHPGSGDALWGGVPEGLKPLYTISMLTAAAGYFPFTFLLLLRVNPENVRFGGGFGYRLLHVLYGLVLVPSALWLPLTFRLIGAWDPALWLLIRLVLALVGLGSVGLLAALATMTPRPPLGLHRLAIAGALAFCMQTALLDALVWPAFFPAPALECGPSSL